MHIYVYIFVLFANSNTARQQIFTLKGLQWKDYEEEVANDLLEEILRMNREQHGHEDIRDIHPRLAALSTYFYVIDHGATTTRLTKDKETISKTTDIKKKSDFEALGLTSSSSSAPIQTKQETFIEKKQLQATAVKVKALQYQALKLSTALAVKGRECEEIKEVHDKFDKVQKLFNEFSVNVCIAIAEIEGSEGDHMIRSLSLSLYTYIYIYI
jgi:hypothetical protein